MTQRPVKANCGCTVAVLIFNLALGGWSFAYCLSALAGKSIPWYGDVVIGMFAGEVTVPLAIVLWLLSLFGIHGPFLGGHS